MSKERSASDLVDHMTEAIDLALDHVSGMSLTEFLVDRKTQQAVIYNILIIGEAASRVLADFPDFVTEHAAIPWHEMRGMRNRLAHGYFEIDLEIVWQTVQKNLPQPKTSLGAIHSN